MVKFFLHKSKIPFKLHSLNINLPSTPCLVHLRRSTVRNYVRAYPHDVLCVSLETFGRVWFTSPSLSGLTNRRRLHYLLLCLVSYFCFVSFVWKFSYFLQSVLLHSKSLVWFTILKFLGPWQRVKQGSLK